MSDAQPLPRCGGKRRNDAKHSERIWFEADKFIEVRRDPLKPEDMQLKIDIEVLNTKSEDTKEESGQAA